MRPRLGTARCQGGRSSDSGLRYQNSSRLPRLEADLGGPRGRKGAVLGNDIAFDAYRQGKQEFPDGAIIARPAWDYTPSDENNKVLGQHQSYVAGPPKEGDQCMVKDSKKYASTGGWGFAQFSEGTPADAAVLKTCFPCHEPVKARDFVFTHYAP